MAGLTTSSLVSLYEPTPPVPPTLSQSSSTTRRSIPSLLGLAPSVKTLNVFALTSSAFFSISYLVFLNSSQPFILTTFLSIPPSKVGEITGTLILADEILSLVLVFIWGALADWASVRYVASVGHLIVGAGLALYPTMKSAIPGVLLARLVFATGASALLTALGAALAGMTAVPSTQPPTSRPLDIEAEEDSSPTERTSLLPAPLQEKSENLSARFAGILGFSTGCGALLAVFSFLRLPTIISQKFPVPPPASEEVSLRRGLMWTYYLIAIIAFVEGLFLFYGLKRKTLPVEIKSAAEEEAAAEKEGFWTKVKVAVAELPKGFRIAMQEEEVALAYLSGFATRAQSIVVTGFIPLFINNYFLSHDLCSTTSLSSLTSESCRRAFIYSSTLTGIIQLISLLLSPLIGYLSSSYSQPLILFLTTSLGAASLLLFTFLKDPENGWVWAAAVGMGISQIGGVVISLALVARGRSLVLAKAKKGGEGEAKEVGGAISAAYSACGGLGILIIGKAGGSLFDKWDKSPFLIVGIVNVLSALACAMVFVREYSRK